MVDLAEHLRRQIAFSRGAFGPSPRQRGVLAHLRKELDELEAAFDKAEREGHPIELDEVSPSGNTIALDEVSREWVDIIILGLDGLTRRLVQLRLSHSDVPPIAEALILRKQATNEARIWPDWRQSSQDAAIEHDRSTD